MSQHRLLGSSPAASSASAVDGGNRTAKCVCSSLFADKPRVADGQGFVVRTAGTPPRKVHLRLGAFDGAS